MPSSRFIIVLLLVAALAVAYRLVLLVGSINDSHPEFAAYWVVGLAVWGMIGFRVANYAEKQCQEKKRTRNCYLEWKGAAGLYSFVTAVVFIFVQEFLK